jgi:uncharacterized membrane protein YesL
MNQSETNEQQTFRPTGWRWLKVFLRRSYDDLFKLGAANLFWFVLCIPVVTIPPATLALHQFAHDVLTYQDPSLKEYWAAVRRWFWRSYLLFGVLFLSGGVPLIAAIFYMGMSEQWGTLSLVLAAVSFWFWVFCMLCQTYFIPFVVHQDIPVGLAIKRSALLVLVRPGVTLLATVIILVLCVGAMMPPFLIFVLGSALAMVKNSALLVGLEDYEY